MMILVQWLSTTERNCGRRANLLRSYRSDLFRRSKLVSTSTFYRCYNWTISKMRQSVTVFNRQTIVSRRKSRTHDNISIFGYLSAKMRILSTERRTSTDRDRSDIDWLSRSTSIRLLCNCAKLRCEHENG